MQSTERRWVWVMWLACNVAALGCTTPESPAVDFGSGSPIGRWQDYGGTASAPSELAGQRAEAMQGALSAGSPGPKTVHASAGSSGPAGGTGIVAAVSGGATGAAGSGGATGAAGSGGAPATTPALLSFDVTTSPVGGRYQPKNIGAIWIQDANGKLVKSLEVWAGIRRRYLTHYNSALSGVAVDVTASATLSSHKTHHASWNLKDRNGAAVAPGKYTLVIELTDGDMTGRSDSVDFDMSAGAQTLTPANAPSFGSMKLQMQ
jgi:hypothetical protein